MKLPLILTQLLGLAEDATAEQAVTAINAMQAQHQLALNAQQDPTKFVPAATHQLALNRTQQLEAQLAEIEQSKVDSLVESAIAEGKVAPADKAMYVGLCSTEAGREQFTAWCSRAPVIADASQVKSKTPDAVDGLTENQRAVCRKMKIAPEQYLASLKQIEGAQ